ncbi:MAG: HAD hydrolase family protein [Candidatus Bathyarchaeota archaeon]|nr:HAD hydrolase family protein [Candidatus Bathyarchaeota archaeon]MDH5746212.1 HAD hydrolase family protein [Candidatus Bathyarchaeota archaeon]
MRRAKGEQGWLSARAKKIKMFVMDVDGTLTDGCTYYSERGEKLKRFMKDGVGISLLKHNDIIPVILTGENSRIVLSRAKKLDVKEVHVNVKDKLKKVSDITFNYKVWLDVNVVYIGDDLSDIEVMKKVVLSFAPADAVEEVKKVAKVVTTRKAGEGAVREAIDYVLKRHANASTEI